MTGGWTPQRVAAALRAYGEECLDVETWIDVSRALAGMPDEARRLLALYAAGYSEREAGRRLGVAGNVSRIFDQALRDLADLLDKDEGER